MDLHQTFGTFGPTSNNFTSTQETHQNGNVDLGLDPLRKWSSGIQVVLAEYTALAGNFQQATMQILQKLESSAEWKSCFPPTDQTCL